MKGCFILQRNFAYIGHNLAVWLKEKYGMNEFCGYVYMRSSYNFLKEQQDILYSNLLLDEEIHKGYKNTALDMDYLRWLENEYGLPNLWPYIILDRVVISNQLVREYPYDKPPYTHEEMLRIIQVKAKAIIEFLEKEKPDFIVFSVIGAIGTMLLYQIAKKKGIKTIVIQIPMIKKQFTLSETYNSLSEIDDALQNNRIPAAAYVRQAKKFIEDFQNTPHPHWEYGHPTKQPISRAKQFSFLLPKKNISLVRWLVKYFYDHFTKNERFDYNYIGPWNYLKDTSKRKLRNIIGANDLYDAVDPTDNFVFFALHFEPEITLSLYSSFFTDQIHVIRHIARSLPVGYFLYVKEHPMMVVYRPRSYYKEIKKIPNVKLISPNITSFDLIQQAKLVTVISGTVGWEACLLKKQVITIGDIFYNSLSFVKNCRTMEQLPWIVKEQLENFKYNEDELEHFVALMFEQSAEVNLLHLWEKENDMQKRKKELEPLADILAKKLGLI